MTTDKVDAFLDKLAALGGEIVDAAKPALHVATEATLTAIQFRGAVGLASSVALVVGAIWLARLVGPVFLRVNKALRGPESEIPAGFAAGLVAVAAFGLAIAAATSFFSANTWMALFRPDAFLAAKALGL